MQPDPHAAQRAAGRQLCAAILALLLIPLALRAVSAAHQGPKLQPTYLPAIEGPRERLPFDAAPVHDLRVMNPVYVVIGDSMAGSRIDPRLLTRLTGQPIAPLLQPGSGPAWWYLALKNWVIASAIHPRCTFIFFRDTNLTSALFRMDDQFRWSVDRVAHDREDEVNAVLARAEGSVFYRVRNAFDRVYGTATLREWLEPEVNAWPAWAMLPYRKQRTEFMDALNERMGLAHLRAMDAADMQAAEDRDAKFDAYVDRSFLPLMLRDAQRAGLTLCFVRVQRRPEGGRPPYQSPALRRYVERLQQYVESHGALFHDDTGDADETIDLYADGDHLSHAGRERYTEIFYNRLRSMFP